MKRTLKIIGVTTLVTAVCFIVAVGIPVYLVHRDNYLKAQAQQAEIDKQKQTEQRQKELEEQRIQREEEQQKQEKLQKEQAEQRLANAILIPPKDNSNKNVDASTKYKAEIVYVWTNCIAVHVTGEWFRYSQGMGFQEGRLDKQSDPNFADRIIIIKNHPQQNTFTTGDVFPQTKCVYIKNVEVGSQTLRLYEAIQE
jgi:hypothetical protein